ncbi:MAG: PIN domain-containing protein [Chloroflexi bacterium]|nr:PIN domain-containing protein [Chloroflexota bacterium]
MVPGVVDTNVFIHAQTHDALADECLDFLEAIEEARLQARLDPMVLHELSYALPHYRRGMSRDEVAEYLLVILAWEGIVADKSTLIQSVERWRDTDGLGFVDAYLAVVASTEGAPVYSKNVRELRGQGVVVPDRLPN